MDKIDLIPHNGGWRLPVEGWKVDFCTLYRNFVTIQLESPKERQEQPAVAFEFEARLQLKTPEKSVWIDPDFQNYMTTGDLVAVLWKQVKSVIVTPTGTLQLEFTEDVSITAPPDPQYESWHIFTPDIKVHCIPSGELAIFEVNKNI